MIEEPLDTAPRAGGIKFSDAVMFLWRRWKLIALVFLAVVALNLILLLQTQPRYTATSEMTLIDPRQQSSPIADLLTGVPLSRQVVEQEITTIRSKAFMIEVVKRLGVDETSPLLQGSGPPPLPDPDAQIHQRVCLRYAPTQRPATRGRCAERCHLCAGGQR